MSTTNIDSNTKSNSNTNV